MVYIEYMFHNVNKVTPTMSPSGLILPMVLFIVLYNFE